MKFTKKLLSLLLSTAMLFSITAGVDFNVNAATAHTQQEAVNWANSQIGKSLDQDGVYGAQCVDLIRYYYIYLGASPVGGNGCNYATNALPSGWSRIKYYSGFTPQPGDVAVWTYTTSAYGHVAIVTSANSSNMNVVEQNGSTHVTRSHSYNYSYGTFWGVIRPNFPSINYLNIGDNFYAYIIKQDSWIHLENEAENVRLSYKLDISDPKQIWHFIRQADNSYKIVNEYDGKCLDAYGAGADNGTNIGTYSDNGSIAQRWFVYWNGSGYSIKSYYCNKVLDVTNNSNAGGTNIELYEPNNSAAQIFSIYNVTNDGITYSKPSIPEKVTITGYNNEKNATVSWSESKVYGRYDNRIYNVSVYKSDGSLAYSKNGLTSRSANFTLPSYGTYKVSVTAVNTKYPNYNSLSESYINLAEHKHTYSNNGTIMEAATCTSNGSKAYVCRECNTIKMETIPATGHSYDAGKVTKQPTATTAGVKTYTCTKCKATKTETIKATGLKAPVLKAAVNANGSFKLSWNKVSGAEKYELYIKQADGSFKLMKTTTGTSFTTAVGAYGYQYTYKMRAVKGNTKSAYSSAVNAKNTKKLQAPTAKATVNANGSFKLSWNKVTGATKYGIYMKQTNGSYKWIKTVTGTSWSTAVAQYGKQYSYKVLAANNNKSAQTFSNVVNAKNTKKLQTPTLKVTVNKNGSFKLSWGKVTGATSYQLYIKQTNGSYKLMKTTSSTSFTTAVAAKGKTYSYKVRAVTSKNKNATSNYSNVVSAKRK